MKKKLKNILADSLAVLGYAAPVGVALWRVLKRKRTSSPAPSAAEKRSVAGTGSAQPELQSLSLNTPGDAPLDRLARTAAAEQKSRNEPKHSQEEAPDPWATKHTDLSNEMDVKDVLDHQSLEGKRLEGWSVPAPERLPVPTYAPAIMAFGIVVFAMGLVTVWYVCLIGSLVFAVAAWRWVGELQGE